MLVMIMRMVVTIADYLDRIVKTRKMKVVTHLWFQVSRQLWVFAMVQKVFWRELRRRGVRCHWSKGWSSTRKVKFCDICKFFIGTLHFFGELCKTSDKKALLKRGQICLRTKWNIFFQRSRGFWTRRQQSWVQWRFLSILTSFSFASNTCQVIICERILLLLDLNF